MKRFFLFALVATMFAACVTDETQDVAVELAPETLTVSFEDTDSRIQLDNGKTVWTKNDLVSVFYLSDANQKWQYQGETGSRTGNLKRINAGTSTEKMQRVVVVYPYNENYFINTDTYNVKAFLPASQSYLKDSYGVGGNIMVSQGEYNQFSLKSVCGWLKVQLTGNGEKVKSIKLKGNNGEQVAGEIYINTADATATLAADMGGADDNENTAGGNLVFDDTILTEVVLDCGEGVELSTEPTAFYIGLPPQTFAQGLTIEIEDTNAFKMTKSTDKEVIISRNAIQPMAAIEYEGTLTSMQNNQVLYTCATKVTFPNNIGDYFGAEFISHNWDSATGKGVLTFKSDVTEIGTTIFYGDDITEIYIPQTVTKIGKQAFGYCSDLKRVYIYDLEQWCNIDIADPSGSPAWYGDVYLNGELLTEITIPDSITKIKNYTFCGWKSINNVHIHDNVTEIGAYGFAFCSFSNITLPMSITSIGEKAFYNCFKLTSFHTPDSVTNIGDAAFWQCYRIKEFTGKYAADNGRSIVINGKLIDYADACGETQYSVPEGVTSIGDAAFRSSELKHIAIPEGVEYIGEYAFAYCESLDSITIPKSLKKTEGSSFYICKNGTKVYITDLTAWCNIKFGDGYTPLSNEGLLYLNDELITHLYIPDDVSKIGDYAFTECASITNITIPGNVKVIGEDAFHMCKNLTDVNIGNGVIEIGGSAFSFCDKITTVNIPNSVTTIRDWGFGSCDNLTKITIPESVTEIEEAAFYSCTKLKEVYCFAINPPVATYGYYSYWNAFDGTSSDLKIYVPAADDDSIINAYKNAFGWNRYASRIVEMEKTEELPDFILNGENKGKGILIDDTIWAPVDLYDNSREFPRHYIHQSSSGYYCDCPEGWRAPTKAEMNNLIQNHSEWDRGYYFSGSQPYSKDVPSIFLGANGLCNLKTVYYTGEKGYYWTTEQVGAYGGTALLFTASNVYYEGINAFEYYCSVRCVKNK